MLDFTSADMAEYLEPLILKLVQWAQQHDMSIFDMTKKNVAEALLAKH